MFPARCDLFDLFDKGLSLLYFQIGECVLNKNVSKENSIVELSKDHKANVLKLKLNGSRLEWPGTFLMCNFPNGNFPSLSSPQSWSPNCTLRRLRIHNLWEFASWEIEHLESCHQGREIVTREVARGKIPNTNCITMFLT